MYALFLGLTLVSCGRMPGPVAFLPNADAPFRPATPPGFVTAQPTATSTPPPGSGSGGAAGSSQAQIDCQDNLVFIADITIPDGTQVLPESTLDKRWEVENGGNCNWNDQYRIRLIAGPEMGAQKELALYPARSGSRAMIRILFKAPQETGTYRSAWQAFNEQGEPFGDPFFVEVQVGGQP